MTSNRTRAQALCFLLLWLILPQAYAQMLYQPSVDYKVIAQPLPSTVVDGKVEVLDFFWYGCGHCNALQPKLNQWKSKNTNRAVVTSVPAVVSSRWLFHGQMFYALQAASSFDAATHQDVFNTIHIEGNTLSREQDLVRWAKSRGKDHEKIAAALRSFSVKSQVEKAKAWARQARITGVPTLVVGGQYLTSVSLAGSSDRLFAVVDYLIDQIASKNGMLTQPKLGSGPMRAREDLNL